MQATERLRNQARDSEVTQRLTTARSCCPGPKMGGQRKGMVFSGPGSGVTQKKWNHRKVAW